MRPKTVLIVFIAGVALLGLLILAKGLAGKGSNPGGDGVTQAVTAATSTAPTVATAEPVKSGVVAMTPQEEEKWRVDKALDEIRDDLANSRPVNLLGKLNSQDKEVRQEAVAAIKALDYTNGIPQLVAAMDSTSDIKEKAAIQEAIEFLQLPTGNSAEELAALKAMQKAQLTKPKPRPVPTNYHGLPGATRPANPVKRLGPAPAPAP
jgi:hypothetical protein